MRKPYCVNSTLCKLLKLAILLISRVEFCSWTMHTDPVVPLTGLFFNVLCMSLAETTSWPSLQYLLIDVIDGHRILSHISFPACGSEWSYLAYSLKVSVNSIAQCEDPTVIGTFVVILLQWLRYVVLKYNLLSCSLLPTLLHQSWSTPMRSSSSIIYRKSLKPSAPTALAFSRPRNRISSVWPLELLVFSTSLQWFMYWLIMVHLTTVRTTLGMTNS